MKIEAIKARVLSTFNDAYVEVTDMTGTSDHIQLLVVTDKFAGQSRIQRQRMVMDVFQPELKTGEVHALTIRAITHDEKNKVV
jgi:stress-induced morphogen